MNITIKNFLIGFLVSFLGSLPLGYLNILGIDLYLERGLTELFYFIFGIISIEILVIYFTLIFAQKIATNKTLLRYISIFSIFFLFGLSLIFFMKNNQNSNYTSTFNDYVTYSSFSIGIILNCLNFLQIPFWAGWNLYLLNNEWIKITKIGNVGYLLGTGLGIFLGMLFLIVSVNELSTFFGLSLNKKINQFFPVVFFLLAVWSVIHYFKKHK